MKVFGGCLAFVTASLATIVGSPWTDSRSSGVEAFAAPVLVLARRNVLVDRRVPQLFSSVGGDEATQNRIDDLVKEHPVLLFMKGSKLFPQCGFSNTAVQILQSYNIDFHTVDVLSDDSIRQGIKIYSQWPTIPQVW
jgi:monothiol glutaredoxin